MRMSDWSSDVYSSDLRRELDDRRASILASIEEQGKLTPGLAREINLADTKTRLEDLYLPYKQKRRTKGQIALEAGLGELADGLFNDPSLASRSEEHTSELQSLMRISYAVFCLKKKTHFNTQLELTDILIGLTVYKQPIITNIHHTITSYPPFN